VFLEVLIVEYLDLVGK